MNAPRRLLSISHLTALNATPPELVSAAADAGFDAVGIRVWPAGDEPAFPVLGDTPMMRDTLSRLADTGVLVLDVEVLRLRPDSRHDDAPAHPRRRRPTRRPRRPGHLQRAGRGPAGRTVRRDLRSRRRTRDAGLPGV